MKRSPRSRKTISLSDSVHQQLNSYALAAGAAGVGVLALGQSAEAKIIYTPAHHVIGERTSYQLDLNHRKCSLASYRPKSPTAGRGSGKHTTCQSRRGIPGTWLSCSSRRWRRLILFVTAFTLVFGFLTAAAPLFAASKEKVLHRFCSGYRCTGGSKPYAGLTFDPAGNLYGTTNQGGAYASGTVFELTRGGNGKWTEQVLYTFFGGVDGSGPRAGLIFDAAGNWYGTTQDGGADGGTAFEITRQPHSSLPARIGVFGK